MTPGTAEGATGDRTAPRGESARLYLLAAAFRATAAAIAHQAWQLAVPACGLAALGPPPVPPLQVSTPASRLALLRQLEQRHRERAWLLAGTVAALGVLDRRTGADLSPHLLAPLTLVLLLLGRARLIAGSGSFVDRLGGTIAAEAGEAPPMPLRSWPPPGAVALLVLAAALAARVPF
jgi:hypothetical protein